MTDKPVPHVHAELIKAWADGAEIQVRCLTHYCFPNDAPWEDFTSLDSTAWDPEWEYRIKPRPKPDVSIPDQHNIWNPVIKRYVTYEVKYTFDGETGDIKKVEIVK